MEEMGKGRLYTERTVCFNVFLEVKNMKGIVMVIKTLVQTANQ